MLTKYQKDVLEIVRSRGSYGIGAESAAIVLYQASKKGGDAQWSRLPLRTQKIRISNARNAMEQLREMCLVRVCGAFFDGEQYEATGAGDLSAPVDLELVLQIVRSHGDLAYVPDILQEIEKSVGTDYEPPSVPDHPDFGPLHERPQCAGSPSCMVSVDGSGTSHGIRCPLFSYENSLAWYKAEIAKYRRWLDCAPPWPSSFKPLDDEGLRAVRLRWATGPERYQADADALIFTIQHMKMEAARLAEEAHERGFASGQRTCLDFVSKTLAHVEERVTKLDNGTATGAFAAIQVQALAKMIREFVEEFSEGVGNGSF